jgi:hypothetical protein
MASPAQSYWSVVVSVHFEVLEETELIGCGPEGRGVTAKESAEEHPVEIEIGRGPE